MWIAWFAVCTAVVLTAGYGVVLVVATWWRLRYDARPVPGLWGVWFNELVIGVRIGALALLGRRLGAPSKHPQDARGTPLVVVLVHGAGVDGTCMRSWMHALREQGVTAPILAVDHGNVVVRQQTHAQRLQLFLHDVLAAAPDARLLLLAHSMGGLVIRHALADDEVLRAATIGAVTMASPHAGTAAANHLWWWSPLGALAPGGSATTALPSLLELVPRARTFGASLDVIVYPQSTTTQPGVHHEVVDGHGHAALMFAPEVTQRVAVAARSLIVDAGLVP
jgi:pimeloyl-ACP methyl ester carboxylesterase